MIVKNVPGAGGRTGTAAIYRSKPDGYTLGPLAAAGMLASQMIMETGFDVGEFEIVGAMSAPDTLNIVVPADSPYKTLKDLQEAARKSPVRYGITGKGGQSMIMGTIAFHILDVPHTQVPGYNNIPEQQIGMLQGDSDVILNPHTNLMFVYEAGDFRCLLQMSKERHPKLPDVPCVTDLGLPEELTSLESTRYAVCPPGTPKDRIAVLAKAMEKAYANPEFIAWAEKNNLKAIYLGAEESTKAMQATRAVLLKYMDAIEEGMAK